MPLPTADASRLYAFTHVRHFSSAAAAIAPLLARAPQVLAFGESHVPREMQSAESATKRFEHEILPVLAPYAHAIVLEMWVANPACNRHEVAAIASKQAPVRATQRQSNPNEFLALGTAAKKYGVMPYALLPECHVYAAIADAGDNDILKMLEVVATTTRDEVVKHLAPPADSASAPAQGPSQMVLSYGGALHNDLLTRPGWEATSFGPALAQKTRGHFIECDLVVPEFVKDTDTWRRLPWYEAYRRAPETHDVRLIQFGESSYALVFPAAHEPQPSAP